MRKHLLKIFGGLLALALGSVVIAANTDMFVVQGDGLFNNIDVLRVRSTGDLRLYSGNLEFDGEGVSPDSANAGTYPSVRVRVKNASGQAIEVGDVLLANPGGAIGTVTIANVTSTTTVVGVAAEAISNGSTGFMAVAGYALVKTTGTVVAGNVLVSSAPATSAAKGYAGGTATPTSGTDIGIALEGATATDLILTKLR